MKKIKITPNNRDIETEARARFFRPAVRSIDARRARIDAHIAAIPFRIRRLSQLTSVLLAVSILTLSAQAFA